MSEDHRLRTLPFQGTAHPNGHHKLATRRERNRISSVVNEVEDPEPAEFADYCWRRFVQWAIARSSLQAIRRTFLQAVALRMGPEGSPSTAGVPRLARDAGLAVSTAYHHLRASAREGSLVRVDEPGKLARKITVTLPVGEELKREVRKLWQSPKPPLPEPEQEWRDSLPLAPQYQGRLRFLWERAIQDASLSWSAKGTAWGTSLLWNGAGLPFRSTTTGEIAGFSGLSWRLAAESFEELEGRVWMARYRDGPGHSARTVLYPRFPPGALERVLHLLGPDVEEWEDGAQTGHGI